MEVDALARALASIQIRGVPGTEAKGSAQRNRSAIADVARERIERATGSGRFSSDQIGVVLSLSQRAHELAGQTSAEAQQDHASSERRGEMPTSSSPDLSEEEEREVRELRARDAEVRAHENAHKAAAGRHSRGAPSYDLERGPDGRQYAVGGEVSIDTSPVPGDPDATIAKMRQVRSAALAPSNPSPQDRRVATEASQAEAAARAEKLEEGREAGRGGSAGGPSNAYAAPAEDRRGRQLDLIA